MKFYLQMGHNMMSCSEKLIGDWGGGNAIISATNYKESQLSKFALKINKINGNVLFDPQIFFPHNGNEKLKEYTYWKTGQFKAFPNTDTFNELIKLNDVISSKEIILPAQIIDIDNYANVCAEIASCAAYFRVHTEKKLLATVCLTSEVINNETLVTSITKNLGTIDVDGYYLIFIPDKNTDYFSTSFNYECGVLNICATLKLKGKKVIVGYSNQQNLLLALTKVDAICSGNFKNTRMFVPSRFQMQGQADNNKRRGKWYYLPDALTEYKAKILDLAKRATDLDNFLPQIAYRNSYSQMLFSGALPSSTGYNETCSFRHYMFCLKKQCDLITQSFYKDTYNLYGYWLNLAESKLSNLQLKNYKGDDRDFMESIALMRKSMAFLDAKYGKTLDANWNFI